MEATSWQQPMRSPAAGGSPGGNGSFAQGGFAMTSGPGGEGQMLASQGWPAGEGQTTASQGWPAGGGQTTASGNWPANEGVAPAIESWSAYEGRATAAETWPAGEGRTTGTENWSAGEGRASGTENWPAGEGRATAAETWPAGEGRATATETWQAGEGQTTATGSWSGGGGGATATKSWPGGDGGTTMSSEGAPDTEELPSEPPRLFLSFDEKKTPVAKQLKRPAYEIHFYLRDNKGKDVLAVTGDDQGDAHYIYRSQPYFKQYGELLCHNRREVEGWLNEIIRKSKAAAPHSEADEEVTVDEQGNYHLPKFVTFTKEKQEFPEQQQHRWVWKLIDDQGNFHEAVEGVERETRDGHYEYHALPPFSSIQPLSVTSMAKVEDWLDKFITVRNGRGATPNMVPRDGHVLPPRAATISPEGRQRRDRERERERERDITPIRGWGDSGARGRSPRVNRFMLKVSGHDNGAATGKRKVGERDATARPRAGKQSLDARLAGCPERLPLDAEVRSALATREKLTEGLHETQARAAVERTIVRQSDMATDALRSAQQMRINWLRETPDPDTAKYVGEWLQSLNEALASLYADTASSSSAPLGSAGHLAENGFSDGLRMESGGLDAIANGTVGGYPAAWGAGRDGSLGGRGFANLSQRCAAGVKPLTLSEALDALRELGSLHLPLSTLKESGLVDTVRRLMDHQEPNLAGLARNIWAQWQRGLAYSLHVLTSPTCVGPLQPSAEDVFATGASQLGCALPQQRTSSPSMSGTTAQQTHRGNSPPAALSSRMRAEQAAVEGSQQDFPAQWNMGARRHATEDEDVDIDGGLPPPASAMMYRGDANDEEGEAAMQALFPLDGGAFLDAGTIDADMMDVELTGQGLLPTHIGNGGLEQGQYRNQGYASSSRPMAYHMP